MDEDFDGFFNIKNLLDAIEKDSEKLKKEYDCMYIYIQIDVKSEESQKEIINYTTNSSLFLLSYVVCKELKVVSDIVIDGRLYIRKAEDRDYSEVIECLVQAYINGTQPFMYEEIGLQKYKENIKTYYNGLLKENLVLIGEYDGEFCGHITLSIDKEDLINRNGEAKLIDVYVLSKFSGLKIGSALTKECERQCMEQGISRIVATVDENINNREQAASILTGLKKEDWKVESIIMLR